MIDLKHILSLDEKERDDAIRKLIVPKPWEHSIVYRPKDDSNWCKKCKLGIRDVSLMGYCPIPDPIALDWNLAMKMRDECESDYEWADARVKVYAAMIPEMELMKKERFRRVGIAGSFFSSLYVKPTDYIIAALVAGEANDESIV